MPAALNDAAREVNPLFIDGKHIVNAPAVSRYVAARHRRKEWLVIRAGPIVAVPVGFPHAASIIGTPGIGVAEVHCDAGARHHVNILVDDLASLALGDLAVPEEIGFVFIVQQSLDGLRSRLLVLKAKMPRVRKRMYLTLRHTGCRACLVMLDTSQGKLSGDHDVSILLMPGCSATRVRHTGNLTTVGSIISSRAGRVGFDRLEDCSE